MYTYPFNYDKYHIPRCPDHRTYKVQKRPTSACPHCEHLYKIRKIVNDPFGVAAENLNDSTLKVIGEYLKFLHKTQNVYVPIGRYFMISRKFPTVIKWPSLTDNTFERAVILLNEWLTNHSYFVNPPPKKQELF